MNKKYIHCRKTQNKKQLMEDKLTQISHTNKRAGGRRNCEKTKHEERIQDKQHIKTRETNEPECNAHKRTQK